jgi:hypothetical protein
VQGGDEVSKRVNKVGDAADGSIVLSFPSFEDQTIVLTPEDDLNIRLSEDEASAMASEIQNLIRKRHFPMITRDDLPS